MKELIYLDNNATSPTDRRVVEAMLPYYHRNFGNPSGLYRLAGRAEQAREEARERVARLINAQPEEIVFTGGGTEAVNFAVKGTGFAHRERGNHIITSAIEHHAVLNSCKWMEKQGFRVGYVEVDREGMVDPDRIRDAISDDTILISVMHGNNEVGTLEPVEEIAAIAGEHNIYFHTDAVQTAGKIPLDVRKLGADLLSLSAHKFHGPKGVGALYVRTGVLLDSLLHGGHHEKDRRAGTENIPGIVGLGKACQIAEEEMVREGERIESLRDRLEQGIISQIGDVLVNGHPSRRLPGTLNICIKFVEGESMLLHLDQHGIAASGGSACTAGSPEPSHVLTAMGIPAQTAHGSLRFSLGRENTGEDIDRLVEVLPPIVRKLREMSPLGRNREDI